MALGLSDIFPILICICFMNGGLLVINAINKPEKGFENEQESDCKQTNDNQFILGNQPEDVIPFKKHMEHQIVKREGSMETKSNDVESNNTKANEQTRPRRPRSPKKTPPPRPKPPPPRPKPPPPIDGGWGKWSSWDTCSASCEGGTKKRTRVCDNPIPKYNGKHCNVHGSSDTETKPCRTYRCLGSGNWGEWSSWTECPVRCGGGNQERTRFCANPIPQIGKHDCNGKTWKSLNMIQNDTEKLACNTNPCEYKCWDTEGDFTDLRGKKCNEYGYKGDQDSCGKYDTNCFKAKEMCCFCANFEKLPPVFGGRMGKCVDINKNALDADRYDCDRYRANMSRDPNICGKYDDQDFYAKEMCCICGGGRFACNSVSDCLGNEDCINGQCIEEVSEFIEKNNHVCSGKVISDHASLSIAKEECKKDSRCNGIFDVGCSGEMFWTCTGNMTPAFILKNNVGRPIDRKLASLRAWKKVNLDTEIITTPKAVVTNHTKMDLEAKNQSATETVPDKSLELSASEILLYLISSVLVVSLVLMLVAFSRKEARTWKYFKKHLENTFIVICIILACYMTTKETVRYFKNEDMSTVGFKYFASSPKDTYPSFSFCLTDEYGDRGEIYSFFNEEIALTYPIEGASYDSLVQILMGNVISSPMSQDERFEIQNASELYSNIISFTLEKIYSSIHFTTEGEKDDLVLSKGEKSNPPMPFYVSYQDPETICFTRNNDKNGNTIRIDDLLALSRPKLEKFNQFVKLKVFVHHPNQLLRGFKSPVFESLINHEESLIDWKKSVLSFTISQVSILRKRSDANTPCNDNLNDDDLQLRIQVSEQVGCIPVYWKKIMYAPLRLETCQTQGEMKQIWNTLQNFTAIHSTYDPPCNEMKSTVTYESRPKWHETLYINFKYIDKNYQEIINVRDFGLEGLWSTAGGFIGIFVGTSLSQVPELVAMAWTWLQNRMK